MGLRSFIQRLRGPQSGPRKRRHQVSSLASSVIEGLEPRLVLYAASGNAWPTAQVITISFQPDGTDLGGVNSNLFRAFDSNPNLAGRWQSEILRAAQVWAQATNINFVLVTDNGAASGSGKYQQGDPNFGDIRIGGYNFGSQALAGAAMPPPINNYSVAGDIEFNTGAAYGIGSGIDLFTVAVHEFGHALGLDHSSASMAAQLYPNYTGIKSALTADDLAGIRSIYSKSAVRSADKYDAAAANGTIATATDITSELVKAQSSAAIAGLDLTTTADVDFYKVTTPKWTDDQMIVAVQSAGLSLLSPKLTVYAADQKTVLGTASGLNQRGTTISVSIPNVASGQTYYIRVEGADASPFGTGNYGLIVDLGAKTTPTITPPKTQKANGAKPSSGGGVAAGGAEIDVFFAPTPVIQTVTPDTGASSNDRVTNNSRVVLNGVSPIGSTVEIFQNGQSIGKFLNLLMVWSFSVPGTLSDGTYTFAAKGKGLLGNDLGSSDDFYLIIDTSAPPAPQIDSVPGANNTGIPATSALGQLTGTSDPSNQITIYDNGIVIGTTVADGYGSWWFELTSEMAGDGLHQYSATATDRAGNTSSPSSSQALVLDTSIATPTVLGIGTDTGSNNRDNITHSPNLVLNGLAEAGSTVTVFRDGKVIGTTVGRPDGTWEFDYSSVSLSDGTYAFTVKAVDAAGNISSLSAALTVVVDRSTSAATVTSVTKTSTLLLSSLIVQGGAEANSSVNVYLNGTFLGTTTADSFGRWTYQYNPLLLLGGNYRFSASAVDLAGNQSGISDVYNLLVGGNAPTVSNLTLASSSKNTSAGVQVTTSTPTITGTATKGSIVSIYDGNRLLGTATVGATGKWTFNSPTLGAGRHSLVAVAFDGSNRSLASLVLEFLI